MNRAFFLQLVFNASLLLSLALIYDQVAVRWRIGRSSWRQVPIGFILGAVGLLVILASWKMTPKIIFDTRSILLSVSGLFFGTVPTVIAALVTAAYRGLMGGPAAAMGVAVIAVSAGLGILWRHRHRDDLADLSWGNLLLLGLVVHLGMLACAGLLPAAVRWSVFAGIALPVLTIYPLVTALLGKLLANHLKRQQLSDRVRSSEERYQTLATISPVGIFRTDAGGATTYVNPMWCRLSGLSEAEAMGEGWLRAVHPDDRATLAMGWRNAVNRAAPSLADYRFRRPDGSVAWVMGLATPEIDAAQQVVGYVGTITDISERKRAEETIRSSLQEKDVLLKEVHHRVKNNLMTIVGLIRMQEDKASGAGVRAMLQELEGRIHSMALVHESLYKSKNLAEVDLQSYIETLVHHIRLQFAADRPIQFRVRAEKVAVDLNQAIPCGLILNELLTNAFKHAFPGGRPCREADGCQIEVVVEKGGDVLFLAVADNGVGLAPEFTWDSSETLGMRLVKMLGQQMKGTITLDRCAGTRFTLEIPLNGNKKS